MTYLPWIGFLLFIFLMLILDLGVFHRKAREISLGEAVAWTVFWVVLALAFNVGVYFIYENNWVHLGGGLVEKLSGKQAALDFFTGYVVEKSLSLDNIFVIALIFSYFGVPLAYQHRVLFWGVLGAVVLRGIMIAGGAVLIHRFDWIVYVFGGLLLVSAANMLVARHDNLRPDRNPLVRLARRLVPVTRDFVADRFVIHRAGKWRVTPLFLVLLLVESSDVLFAVDSIPAIFAITHDPFLVYTSNIFAILGLRSLYFALAAVLDKFHYLRVSLVFLLAFIGVKMILSHHIPIPTDVSLGIIGGILGVGLLASILGQGRDTSALVSPIVDNLEDLAELTYTHVRKVIVLVVGSTVVLAGVVMIVLPGPAVVVIPTGLAILATEFVWARHLLRKAKQKLGDAANSTGPWFNKKKK